MKKEKHNSIRGASWGTLSYFLSTRTGSGSANAKAYEFVGFRVVREEDNTRFSFLRGGSWNNIRDNARCAVRIQYLPEYRHYYYGFRCVREE